MARLTIAVDEATLKQARKWALKEHVSINAVLRGYLEEYAGWGLERIEAARRIIEASRASKSGSEPGGRKQKREDAYEERLGRYPNR